MAVLLFYAGENRFAIDCTAIVRVVPNVILKEIPQCAHFVAGLLILGGKPIPVIDFCKIVEKRATRPFLSSKIIILKDTSPGLNRCVGLLGERVEEIAELRPDQFNQVEFYFHDLPYLTKGFSDANGIIHLINLEELFLFLSTDLFHDTG